MTRVKTASIPYNKDIIMIYGFLIKYINGTIYENVSVVCPEGNE